MDGVYEGGSNRRLIAKELQLQRSSERHTLYFHGESMRPLLIEGDAVVVKPVRWDSIRIGDIVTYRHLDRFPTRRVVRKTDEGLDLWCENWPDRFFWALREDVLGRVVARRRGAEWLARNHLRWRVAGTLALARYARRIPAPMRWIRLRGMVGDLLRALKLRRPRREP